MMEDIIEFVKGIGIPGGLLLILIYKVVLPVTDSHMAFIKSLKESIEQLSISQKNLTETVNNLSKTIEMIEKKIGK